MGDNSSQADNHIRLGNLTIDDENRQVDLGTITLQVSAIELEGAEITAEKLAVEYRLDRKVSRLED